MGYCLVCTCLYGRYTKKHRRALRSNSGSKKNLSGPFTVSLQKRHDHHRLLEDPFRSQARFSSNNLAVAIQIRQSAKFSSLPNFPAITDKLITVHNLTPISSPCIFTCVPSDYKLALTDFTKVALEGIYCWWISITFFSCAGVWSHPHSSSLCLWNLLLPILGLWWYGRNGQCRKPIMLHVWWEVNASNFCQEIVRGYEQRGIPLDVMVTDMDWHITFYKEAAEGKKDQVSASRHNRYRIAGLFRGRNFRGSLVLGISWKIFHRLQ